MHRWHLEDSIWGKERFQTKEDSRKMFLLDWDLAVRSHELGWFIVKCHNDPSQWRDLDRNGIHDEVDEVREVLWEYQAVLNGAFDYYAALFSEAEVTAGEPDIYHISFNGFMAWVEQCKLLSRRCPHGEFETIFSIVNATDRCTSVEEKFNSKTALNRQEFLQCIVRCAVAVYVKRGQIGDVSDAVRQLMVANLVGHLPPRAFQNSNAFRRRFCYNQRTSAVLEDHETSLRSLYTVYAEVSNRPEDTLKDASLMSVGEWLSFLSHLGLLETGQLTALSAKYIFLWSRIPIKRDTSEAAESSVRHLRFHDFLEAVVRTALSIALPTDVELEEAGARDAGEFMLALQSASPVDFQAFLTSHRPKHTDPNGSDFEKHAAQPVERCVDHFIRLVVRIVEHNTCDSAALEEDVPGSVDPNEAAKFLKRRLASKPLQKVSPSSLCTIDFTEVLENAAFRSLRTAAATTIQLMYWMRQAKRRVAAHRQRGAEPEPKLLTRHAEGAGGDVT